jgi:hypothetical protein
VKRAVIGAAALGGVVLALVVLLPLLLLTGQPDAAACGTAAPAAGTVAVGSTGGLNANQLSNAGAIIAAARADPAVGDKGAIVLLMAASQEDSLNNSNVANDHDSLGLFQMRPSMGWGTPEQVTNIPYELAKMISVLKQVPGWQSMDPGQAAQAIERSAFPGAYAKWQGQANALLANAGGTAVTPVSAPVACAPPAAGTPGVDGRGILTEANKYTGLAYIWGGSDPSGFDCSGFTSWAYLHGAGITIPRTSEAQQAAAQPVTDPKPGDLVFFGNPAHHVGMVVDPVAGTMIDSPNTGSVIRIDHYKTWSDLSGFGRF